MTNSQVSDFRRGNNRQQSAPSLICRMKNHQVTERLAPVPADTEAPVNPSLETLVEEDGGSGARAPAVAGEPFSTQAAKPESFQDLDSTQKHSGSGEEKQPG
ncbi:hypothetical protein JOB18_046689 [Solea senegalensis]|uniref:Uncharacterized protein n=1 Tax=Solea senegalensis TaxID=28829 RepID=A0AAV6Q8J0_SOLSE|nr:hypothetical protein JOB18_046689 [Solea senegalensis]